MVIKTKTFKSDLVNYIEYKVSILDETVIITEKSNLSGRFKSVEISRTVFEKIIEFFKGVGSDSNEFEDDPSDVMDSWFNFEA